jgi:tetratricopeptide (TPR) repeat protein
MNEDRLRDLFERVVELASEERTRFLVDACGDDDALKDELQALLAADAHAVDEEFWQRSALHNQVIAEQGTKSAVGEIIGTYRLVELIGKGGMGAVYRAVRVDAEFEKCVAVKLIDAIFYSSDVIAQFRAERQILANLDHANIARLLDGGARADGLPYLIMEYVEGISPYDYCRDNNLTTTQRLLLFQQICSAVHSAHQNGVIHRDLKPANSLVTAEGIPKLLDFGIAKVLNPDPSRSAEALTEPGMLKLTARYASPEQVRGEPVTTASDIYSLGVILYELLAGHSPYGDQNRPAHQIMHAVCEVQPARPSVWVGKLKGDLDNIVLRALRKSPLERYASADQFSEDILRHLEGRPVQARGDAPLYVAAKFIRRNRVVVAAAGFLLCSLVGGLIEVTLARTRAERRFNEVRQLEHSVMFDYADAIDRLPGATPVRARLVKDALTYLDNLSKEADTPQLQREIVDAYVRVSNVQGNEYENNLGDTAAALSSARKAIEATEKLLREDKTPPAEGSAANAFSTYGSLLYSTGDLEAADVAYQRALGLYQKIAVASPQDLENKISLSTCLRHLGDLYGGYGFRNLGKTAESLAYYEQAKTLVLALDAQFPSNIDITKESYKTLLSLTSAEAATGRHDEAAKDLEEALARIQRVSVAEPDDTNAKVELAIAEARLGQMLLDDRNADGAVQHMARSAELLQKLLDADHGNAIYRRGQSVVEAQWAAALRGAGQISAAVAHNERALQLAQGLNKDAPGSVQYRSDLGNDERKLSEGLVAAGNAVGALHHAEQAEQILCQNDPGSTDPNGLANCGRSLLAAGNADRALRNPKAAVTAFRKAVEIASARIGSRSAQRRFPLRFGTRTSSSRRSIGCDRRQSRRSVDV